MAAWLAMAVMFRYSSLAALVAMLLTPLWFVWLLPEPAIHRRNDDHDGAAVLATPQQYPQPAKRQGRQNRLRKGKIAPRTPSGIPINSIY